LLIALYTLLVGFCAVVYWLGLGNLPRGSLIFWCGLLSIVVLWLTFRRPTLLNNPSSGLTWKREAVCGITLRSTLMRRGERIAADLPSSRPPIIPPSVTKLGQLVADSGPLTSGSEIRWNLPFTR
jgi:hypothetical protein